jgi:hypothetical protein
VIGHTDHEVEWTEDFLSGLRRVGTGRKMIVEAWHGGFVFGRDAVFRVPTVLARLPMDHSTCGRRIFVSWLNVTLRQRVRARTSRVAMAGG